MDRGIYWATVNGATKSQTRLSTHRAHQHTGDIVENWEIFVLFGVHREKWWEVSLEGEQSGPRGVFGKAICTELGRNVKKHVSTKPLMPSF